MKMSNLYMPTLREVPNDADIVSAQYLLRAGMIRKLVSGVYSFLPLGFRVMKKVEAIVREEMDRADAQEVLMSAIQPREIWEESGRWANFGPEMFTLQDRNQRDFCLGPTHEEYFTFLVNNELNSYKQLPLCLYQVQTKYRDERRPRFGLIRSREFIMKDAYTFDVDEEGLRASYNNMWQAYEKAFDRIGFKYKVVQGDSGNMGGLVSHEFIAITPEGESNIAYCDACDFAATDEVAGARFDAKIELACEGEPNEKVHTPNVKTISDLETFFNVSPKAFIKTLLLKVESTQDVIAVMIPGNRELNIVKLSKFLEVNEDDLVMLQEEEVYPLTGSIIGFVGPFGLKESVRIVADERVFSIVNGICGANEKNYHLKNVVLEPSQFEVAEDLLSVEAGDLCPHCGQPLKIDHGTEVGNIFQLGDKYSKAMNATFLDKDGKSKHFVMGSYGIGISRCVAALVEQFHDDKGIIWPVAVAPYHVLVTVVNPKKEDQLNLGMTIYESLKEQGVEVVLDDRKVSPGVKFTDADLIGIPLRIVVGKKAGENIVEVTERASDEKIEIAVDKLNELITEKLNA